MSALCSCGARTTLRATTNEKNVASQKKASLFARTNSQHFLKQRQRRRRRQRNDAFCVRAESSGEEERDDRHRVVATTTTEREGGASSSSGRRTSSQTTSDDNTKRTTIKKKKKKRNHPSLLPSRPGCDIHHKLPHEIKSSKSRLRRLTSRRSARRTRDRVLGDRGKRTAGVRLASVRGVVCNCG